MENSNHETPKLPALNLKYGRYRNIIFESSEGKIMFEDGHEEQVQNIIIKFFENISIEFETTADTRINFETHETFDLETKDNYEIIVKKIFMNFVGKKIRGDGRELVLKKGIFDEEDMVKTWSLIEDIYLEREIDQEFTKIKGLFLKSWEKAPIFKIHKDLCDEYKQCPCFKETKGYNICEKKKTELGKELEIYKNEESSLEQFSNITGVFYYEDKLSQKGDWNSKIYNIYSLLMLYTSNI